MVAVMVRLRVRWWRTGDDEDDEEKRRGRYREKAHDWEKEGEN